ncbi:hypothetical protein CNMCM8980_004486 [Aspergillus fumigatiaffinis]|jgi:ketosteroid isomerase-like protein|nr:hypothetical protein CNMCM8980_004486 [Aspergillus fumigatiaffinis]
MASESSVIEQRLAVLEAREAIREVLYTYARAADRADLELFKSCYHADGTDCHWFYNGNAHEFANYVIPLLRKISNSQHSITNAHITLNGNRAFVESQWYVLHRIPLDTHRLVDQQCEGRYLDMFEKRDGVWKILHRRVVCEAFREHVLPVLNGKVVPPDHPAAAKRAPHDHVYKGMSLFDEPFDPVGGVDLWDEVRQRYNVANS